MRNREGLTDEVRQRMLKRCLYLSGGSVTQTAEMMAVSRRTVYRWMQAYGIVISRITSQVLDE